nr:MAG TPA: hypothetical protein [Caudoviricetes sp.]
MYFFINSSSVISGFLLFWCFPSYYPLPLPLVN